MLHSRRVSLMMLDDSGEYLTILAATGMPQTLIESVRLPAGAGLRRINLHPHGEQTYR